MGMNIGYVFDEGFVKCAMVSLVSLFENNRNCDISIFIFDDGIEKESIINLKKLCISYNCEITFFDISVMSEKLKDLGVKTWRGKYSAYLKVIFSELLPDRIDRILIIDADTIIEGDIDKLYFMPMENNVCAMTIEAVYGEYGNYSKVSGRKIYNAGVILYDLKKWNELDCTNKFIDYLKSECSYFLLPEEEPMAIVFDGMIKTIPPKYNFISMYYLFTSKFYFRFFKWTKYNDRFYTLDELKDSRNDIIIYHCTDTFTARPWNEGNIHPYSDIFEKYWNISKKYGIRKDDNGYSGIAKVEHLIRKYLPSTLSLLFYALSFRIFYGIRAKHYYKLKEKSYDTKDYK